MVSRLMVAGVIAVVSLLVLALALLGGSAEEFVYDFSTGDHGWMAEWVDLPADYDAEFYMLESDWRQPPDLGGDKALFISSDNHADDVFMFFKKQLEGLRKNQIYRIVFEVEVASSYPEGSVGIGGSPGDSVYLKGGASTAEPVPVVDGDGWLRLSVDKGNQAEGGEHAAVLGTIAKPDDGTERYVVVSRNNRDAPVLARSDENGNLWVFAGTDSGFEGYTGLYYISIRIALER